MKYINPNIESSFRENDLGRTIYDFVLEHKPKKIIEFGVLNGYSTVCMAMALDEIGEGHIFSCDLWSKYPYKHGEPSVVENNIKKYKLEKYVTLCTADFYIWTPEVCDMLFVDISNDGDTIVVAKKILEKIGCKLLFEGGTLERDNIEWMIKYNKPKINSSANYRILNDNFPSLSCIL